MTAILSHPALVAIVIFAVVRALELVPWIKARPSWVKVIGAAGVAAGPAAASLAMGVDPLTVLESFGITVAASAGVNAWAKPKAPPGDDKPLPTQDLTSATWAGSDLPPRQTGLRSGWTVVVEKATSADDLIKGQHIGRSRHPCPTCGRVGDVGGDCPVCGDDAKREFAAKLARELGVG